MPKNRLLFLPCYTLLFVGPLSCAYAQDAEEAKDPDSAEESAETEVEWLPGSRLRTIKTETEMDGLLKKAESGNAQAQYDYGIANLQGYLMEQDKKKGIEWMRKAAGQDLELAIYNMGFANMYGIGLETNKEEAVSWFKRSAAKGNHPAQYELGLACMEGRGTTKDEEVGVKWLGKAANGGITAAQYELGRAYFNGEGVEQDYSEAFAWGHLASRYYVGAGELIADLHMELDPKQYKKAKARAAELKKEVEAKLAENDH